MQAVLSELVLVESRSARQGQLEGLPHDEARSVLDKAKGLLYFASIGSTEVATTDQMAEFYEVPPETIRTTIKRNLEELESDGLKTLRGKALKDVSFIMKLSSQAPHLTLWTPRAALRLGMLLRDSEVAKQVRTVLLDRVKTQPQSQFQEEVLGLMSEIKTIVEKLTIKRTVKTVRKSKSSRTSSLYIESVTAFFNDCLTYDKSSDQTYSSAELHSLCSKYCESKNLPRPSLQRMAQILKQLAPNAYQPRRRIPAYINPECPRHPAFWQHLTSKA